MAEIKTSFIPKKETAAHGARRTRRLNFGNVFVVLSVIVFLLSIAGYGGLFLYRALVSQQIGDLSESIETAREIVRPSLIESLRNFDSRITSAEDLLEQHIVLSPLFNLLESVTLQNVRFTDMEFQRSENSMATVELSGEASGYATLAYQSQVLSEHPFVEDPVFSNFGLSNTGGVLFDVAFTPAAQLLDYRAASAEAEAVPAAEEIQPADEETGSEETTSTEAGTEDEGETGQ